jgi:hypothetical protein
MTLTMAISRLTVALKSGGNRICSMPLLRIIPRMSSSKIIVQRIYGKQPKEAADDSGSDNEGGCQKQNFPSSE